MANHTAVKVGGWAFREKLTATQITGIQERLLKCPNLNEGSTHSLTGDLNLNDGGGRIYCYLPVTFGADGTSRTTIGGKRNYPTIVRTVSASFNITSADASFSWWLSTVANGFSVTFLREGFANGDEIEIFNAGAGALDVRDELSGSFCTALSNTGSVFRLINQSIGFKRVWSGVIA